MGPVQPVSDENLNSVSPAAAIDDFGTGAVAWNEPMGMAGSIPRGRTIDSLGAPAGGIQELFSKASVSRSSSAPTAGVAAFLMETPFSGGNRTVLVRRHLVPPRCANSTATVVQGRRIEAALACTGPAIEGAQVIEPPKHGRTGAFKAGPTLEYTPTPGFAGKDSFTYTASNDGGSSNQATVEIKVGKDTVRPRIRSFRFVQTVQKPRAKASAKKARKRIYKFLLRFSERATARVAVEKPGRGIRRGKRCAKPRKGVRGKRCTRYRRIGAVSKKGARRSVTIVVRGKLVKRLRRGDRFRATAVATDPARNRSKPKTLKFRTTKRRTR
jgi:hypothetical protein